MLAKMAPVFGTVYGVPGKDTCEWWAQMPRIQMDRSGEMAVFDRVVRDGSFSAAARALDLTPSAVSKLIARLEARLGVRLFVRTTRALTLTHEGEAYHQATARILREMEEADRAVAAGPVRGRLSVTASVPFGRMYVAPAVPAFLAAHPGLTLDLSLSDDIVDLGGGRVDVAIRVGTLTDSALMARKLGESRRVVVASPAYLARRGVPRVPADLAHHDCLRFTFRRPGAGWPFRTAVSTAEGAGGPVMEQPLVGPLLVNNGETMKQMALAGVGIARVGLFHVEAEIARGDLVVVLEDHNPGDVEYMHAVYVGAGGGGGVGGGLLPARVRAFIDHMVAHTASQPALHPRAPTPVSPPRRQG